MKNIDDLVALLNFANLLLYPKNYKGEINVIQKKSVTFYANPKLSGDKRYTEFSIKKKTGGERKIAAPHKSLKLIQCALNLIFSVIYEPKEYVTGFVSNKSIVDNAKIHVGRNYVYNIDLENFFPSIELNRIKAVLKLPPFSLDGTEREKIAYLIACLACKDGRLPQGSPTSPVLSNIVCQKMDRRLRGFANAFNCRFTRYADDITFSASKDMFNQSFKTELKRIIEDQNFTINEKKVRLQGRGYKQEVTGLIVNEKLNVSKKYVREVRAMLNNWDKLGYEKASEKFAQHYNTDKGHIKKQGTSMQNVVWGKLQFLKMVKGKEDAVVLRYEAQYKKLNPEPLQVNLNNVSLSDMLSIWENDINEKEIEGAMKLYYSNLGEMQKGKNDFMIDLLADNRIEAVLREKVSDLTAKKLKRIFSVENENRERISEIENKLLKIINVNLKEKVEQESNYKKLSIPFKSLIPISKENSLHHTHTEEPKLDNLTQKIHKPKDVADFMSLFNLPNGLKYLTHDYDEGGEFDIEVFLSKANRVFLINTNYPKSIPQSLWQIINNFAFSDNPKWGNKQIDGWSKPEWIEWSKKQNKHLKRNPAFEKIIEKFRNYTRVESPKLTSILNEVIKDKFNKEFNQIDLNIIDCDKADFYTHVDNFKESIGLIFDGIKKRINPNNKVTINYLRKTDGDYFKRIIKICHHNSFPTKPLDEFITEIGKEEKGELGDISRKLRGYCNWSIETNWDNQPVRINILQEIGEIEVEYLDIDIPLDGFTHILTFYYK